MLGDMKHIIAASLLLLAVPALSQDISGVARAADGDSLDFGGIAVRLHGIDAPELSQTCERPDGNWPCGKAAAAKLAALVGRQQIICEQHDIDAHGRTVAACRAGATDLAGAMVDAGLAVPYYCIGIGAGPRGAFEIAGPARSSRPGERRLPCRPGRVLCARQTEIGRSGGECVAHQIQNEANRI